MINITKRQMHKYLVMGEAKFLSSNIHKIGIKDKFILHAKDINVFDEKCHLKMIEDVSAKISKKQKIINFEERNILFDFKKDVIMESEIYKKMQKSHNINKMEETKEDADLDIRNYQEAVNERALNNYENLVLGLKDIKFTKKAHSFVGVIKNEKIYFVFCSSKAEAKAWGWEIQNIKIEEQDNPIEYVNCIHVMDLDSFKNVMKTSSPDNMLNNVRFGKNNDYDMAYCSLRAFFIALTQSTQIISYSDSLNSIDFRGISYQNNVFYDNNKQLWTPAEAKFITDSVINEDEIAELHSYIDLIKNDIGAKREIVGIVGDNHSLYLNAPDS